VTSVADDSLVLQSTLTPKRTSSTSTVVSDPASATHAVGSGADEDNDAKANTEDEGKDETITPTHADLPLDKAGVREEIEKHLMHASVSAAAAVPEMADPAVDDDDDDDDIERLIVPPPPVFRFDLDADTQPNNHDIDA